MYVLDTNTLIYFFKGQGKVADRLFQHSPKQLAIPSIVLYELQVGILKSNSPAKRGKQLSEMLSVIKLLPFAEKEAECAASIRAKLESAGTAIGTYDLLIAGTAKANSATLVTHNSKEFSRVDNLLLEDWY